MTLSPSKRKVQHHQQQQVTEKPEKPLDFEEQMQEIAGNIMFPLASGTILLFHLGLALFTFPAPKYTHFNAHLQGFLILFLPYYLFERNGLVGKRFYNHIDSMGRRTLSWACMGLYGLLWLMILMDKSLIGERPGARMMGVVMGSIVGTWLGLISSSAAILLEMMDKNRRTTGSANASRPKNRKERRLAARKAASTSTSSPSKKRS